MIRKKLSLDQELETIVTECNDFADDCYFSDFSEDIDSVEADIQEKMSSLYDNRDELKDRKERVDELIELLLEVKANIETQVEELDEIIDNLDSGLRNLQDARDYLYDAYNISIPQIEVDDLAEDDDDIETATEDDDDIDIGGLDDEDK